MDKCNFFILPPSRSWGGAEKKKGQKKEENVSSHYLLCIQRCCFAVSGLSLVSWFGGSQSRTQKLYLVVPPAQSKAVAMSSTRPVTQKLPSAQLAFYVGSRTGYIICGAQCKMKMWGTLFKNHYERQGSDSRTLNQAQNPSARGALCDCRGCTSVVLTSSSA
ncbi:uncharacterized protein RBU33_007798 isoform 1-T4 [Hipposideros larvatus]